MAAVPGVPVTGVVAVVDVVLVAGSADVVSFTPASANVACVWLADVDCVFAIVAAGSIVSIVTADAGAAVVVASVVAAVGATVVVVAGTEVVSSSVGLAVVDSGFPIMHKQR